MLLPRGPDDDLHMITNSTGAITTIPSLPLESHHGSAGGPVTIAVFKTVDRRLSAAMVGSTPTRFRQFSIELRIA